ncbi:helix-turn-helix domain-containing protein [Cupriavidus agavae]|nr:AraC family transcriptional regulator [Cupriavidus agavae]
MMRNPTPFQFREKYNDATLVMSSAGRAWSGLFAEVRDHSGGIITRNAGLPFNELVIDPHGSTSAVVTRTGYGLVDRTPAKRGTVWLCPKGIQEDEVSISTVLPGMLHLYLDPALFTPESLGESATGTEANTFYFDRGFEDPLIAQIGLTILAELREETPTGNLLVESLAGTLAVRMLHRRASVAALRMSRLEAEPDLAQHRMRRVMDYIRANLESDIRLDDLASIACLSRFHFVRAFKAATGKTPYRCVTDLRIERAKTLLRLRQLSLMEIAVELNFSSQATFTRAFRAATGYTPGQYPGRN